MLGEVYRDGLNGLDKTELNSFIQKKQWIDEKIKFLQDLPPIKAIDPLPPSKSPTSFEELENWLNEHELIEKEVSLYDMGDLSKLKEFAKSASKSNLSVSDAQYIEITLTTLLSVDKLFHLLRQRKKCLNLLNYRLKWESQVASAWIEHRKILTDLPRFLLKARWTAPSELSSRTRKTSSPESLLSSQDNNSANPPSPTTASLRTLSVSLASLIDPSTSPPRSSNSTSAMSRTMRSEVLSLSLASQKSAIHSLMQSTLPNTANLLDKLIDTSPIPLPDAFLDEQENLEEASKSLTEGGGLATFLSAVVTQWRHADEIFWCTRALEVEGNSIMRDLEEAVLKLPDSMKLKSFEERFTSMDKDLKELEEKRWSNGFLPLPVHSSVEDQEEENVKLVEVLEKNLIRARDYLGRSREAVKGYQFAVTSLEESREVRKEMERRTVELNEFLIQLSELEGKPDLTTSKCLIPTNLSISFFNQFTKLSTSIQSTVSSIQPLLLQSSKILVNLNKAGIDPNVRQAVRETMAGLSSIKEKVVETLRKEELAGRKVKAAQDLEKAVNFARKRINEVEESLQKNILECRWTCTSSQIVESISAAVEIQVISQEVEEILVLPSATATQLLARSEDSLLSHLNSLSATLLPTFDSIQRQNALFDQTKLQREEATSIINDLEIFKSEVFKLESVILGDIESSNNKNSNYQAELSTLEASFNVKAASIFKDITFLNSSIPLSPLLSASLVPSTLIPYHSNFLRLAPSMLVSPFDLSEQDEVVRNAINSQSAAIGGSIEELKKQNKVLQHQISARCWDSGMKALEEKLKEIENGNVGTDLEDGSFDDSALETVISRTTSSLSIISNIRAELDSYSHSLTTLQSDPVSSSPLFNSHSARRSSLRPLSQRHQLTQDKFSSVLSLASKLVAVRDAAVLERSRLAEIEVVRIEEERKAAELKAEEEKRILGLEQERLEANKLQEAQEIEQVRIETLKQAEVIRSIRIEEEAIVSAASLSQDLDDVFGPIVINPFPVVDEEDTSDVEQSPIMHFSSKLSNVLVDHWQDQQIFYQLPSISDAQHLAQQLAPLQAQLQDIKSQDDSFDYVSIKLELRRKTLAIAQIDCLAQFKSKVELADDAFSNLLTSIDHATPGMLDNLKESDNLDFESSSVISISEALRVAGNAITVVRKHSIPLLEDSRVLSHIRRLELTFDDMSGMIEDLTPRRSLSSASASSTYSNSRIPTPSRSIRSVSASSSHQPMSNSSSSRPPSSLFSSSSSTFTRNGSKPSLQSYNTPTQRKRHSSSASSAVSSIVSGTPRPSRIHSNPNATPRAFAVPSSTKNAFGMSFGQSTASRKSAITSSTPTRRDRASSIQNRNGLDTSPAFSHPTGASSRKSTFASSPTLSPSTLFTKTKQRYKSNPNSVIDVALGKVINDFPGIVCAKAAENNTQSESGMYWIGDVNPKLYFCRILRSKNIFLRTGGGWLNLIEFLNKNYSQAPDSPGSPNISRWIIPATARSQLSLSTSSVSLSRSLSAGLSPRIVSDNILSTPRKTPIAPPPWKF